jgi:putative ABC transport system ATP-binding protein
VSFDVASGEWLLIVGHNGSGKSTLIKAIGGQLRPDAGKVMIDGRSVLGLTASELSERVFTVHQDPLVGSAPLLTVFENLLVADPLARRSGARKSDLSKRYRLLLEEVDLAERIYQPVKVLSGGERQLLTLAVAHPAGRALGRARPREERAVHRADRHDAPGGKDHHPGGPRHSPA